MTELNSVGVVTITRHKDADAAHTFKSGGFGGETGSEITNHPLHQLSFLLASFSALPSVKKGWNMRLVKQVNRFEIDLNSVHSVTLT